MCLVLGSLHRNCSNSYLPHTPLLPVFTLERALAWDLRQLEVISLLCHQLVMKDEQTPVALPLQNEVLGLVANFPDCLSTLQLGFLPSPVFPAVFIRPALHLFSSCCSDVLGGNRKPEAEVQVPRHLRQLSIQDLLEGSSRVPGHRGSIEGAVGQSHLHRYPQPQFWSLPAPPTSPSSLRRASLLREVSRLL